MKRGAFNYVYKPLDIEQLQASVLEALDVARRMRAPVTLQQTLPEVSDDHALFGACPGMLEVYKAIGRVAEQDVTVLITGESGTGKELVARALYQHSMRSKATFLALNCAAIPDNLLESELFGHEKGAFTGADRRRIGKFEQHSGGTILLDEIGDMPLPLQAKVLRLLQEQTFERMGGNQTVQTDLRLIAATHRDLEALVEEGQFRLDLYYRLRVFTIHLPPLRERGADVPLLVQYYVRRFSRELGREVRPNRARGDGAIVCALVAREHPRAAERAQAGRAARARLHATAGLPPSVQRAPPLTATGQRDPRALCTSTKQLRHRQFRAPAARDAGGDGPIFGNS